MSFVLMQLPFEKSSLEPYMSAETLDYHHGKHHQTYVNNLNKLIEGTDFAQKSLEDIIKSSDGGLFNNAAQVFNHNFFWNCLSPIGQTIPANLESVLVKNFGSTEKFKEMFTQKAITQFGSGWAWLVKDSSGSLSIVTTSNANTPITDGLTPILVCDVWEHAYYIDTRNARPQYLENFWNIVNWEFVANNI